MTRRLSSSRRSFLQSSLAASGLVTISALAKRQPVHAAGSEMLNVGLVGCGPRGTGAAVNALSADAATQLTAMADLFPDRIEPSLQEILKARPGQVKVDRDHQFTGFDACAQLLASGVDVVLIALPTYFHPQCLEAAIQAGKHVFCEKIHAVDAVGVRRVWAAGEEARRRGLSVVSGLAWRYDTGVQETMKRVHDGAIGDIVSIVETCNTGGLRSRPRQAGWSEMEYQIRDWFNFYWLSCDLPGLNLVHNLDKAAWALHEEPPLRAWGMGGRESRVGPQYGDAWDHHAIVYEYANGIRLHAYCRQQDGCQTEISDIFYGTKGRCDLLNGRIDGQTKWRYEGPPCNRFDLEHVALFSSIREGQPINNSLYMGRSSLLGIMATWATYSGQVISWDEAVASEYCVAPARLALDAPPPTQPDANGNYPRPVPGISKFR
jgi:predicted dehydrogenase